MQHLTILITWLVAMSAQPALAIIDIGLSGSTGTSNFSLETHERTSLSVNFSVAFGSYIHLGLTHRRAFEEKSGLKKGENSSDETVYLPFEDNTENITNSLDLMVFLNDGRLAPFVFGGVARRDYLTEINFQGQEVTSRTTLYPVPNYGFGASIRMTRRFRFKVTQTYTPGVRTVVENGEEVNKPVNDSYTQLGISYRL
jgi:hypothetical protein